MTGPSTEIDDMFRLIAAGQIDQARALIAATRAEFPSWEPPAAMTDLLATADGQMRFDAALAAGNLSQAISVASSVPGLLRCNRINNAWRIAEAQAAAGRAADAFGTYRSVAGTCVVTADLIATLEKADAVASEAEILALLSQVGQRLPAIDPELQTLRSRLLAGRGHDIAAPAGVVTAPVEPPAAGKTPKATPARHPLAKWYRRDRLPKRPLFRAGPAAAAFRLPWRQGTGRAALRFPPAHA